MVGFYGFENILMQAYDVQYNPSPLQFSESKIFFQNQNQLLQKIGFFSPASIDVNFKYTFQQVEPKCFIQGGEFEGITMEHKVHETGIIYKIGFSNPRYKNVKCLSVDLTNSKLPIDGSVISMIKSFPIIPWAIFLFLILLIPFSFGKRLFWINVVGAGVLLLFTIFKIFKIFWKLLFQTKKINSSGLSTNYEELSDTLFLSPNIVNVIRRLEDFQIVKLGYTGNCMYLLQDIKNNQKNKGLIQKVWHGESYYSEQEKAELQQKTMSYLLNSDFLSNFM